MKLKEYIKALLCVALIAIAMPYSAKAQYHQERGLVRKGNEQFEKRNYRRSLENYASALEVDSTNYEAQYNYANAYHHAMYANPSDRRYNAEVLHANYEKILADTLLSDKQRAEVYRNYGESLFTEKNYEAALNSFRESLILNPADKETKYNYVLTKRIVDQKRQSEQQQNQNQQNQNQNGGGNGEQNQDQNQQQNRDDNNQNDQNNQGDNRDNPDNQPNQNDQNKESDDKGGDNKDGDKENNEKQKQNPDQNQNQNGENEEDGARPEPKELSPEQQRILDAMQAEEDKTQEKLKEGQKGIIIPGKKNW